MPPKAKFTREEVIEAGLALVRAKGFESLTARAVGERLGSSARPIFTVFENMEEVQQGVKERAKAIYSEYIAEGLAEKQSFRGVGKYYILFAMKEPKLFQLLFMNEQKKIPDFDGILPIIDDNYLKILQSVQKDYGMSGLCAEKLYRHLWIYSHGIATLCATKMCRFTGEELSVMMAEVCRSLIKNLRSEENQ